MGQSINMSESEISGSASHSKSIKLQPLNCNLPEEVLIHILSYVDANTLVSLRRVCHLWKHLIDNEVWRLKISRKKYWSLKSVEPKQKLPWFVYYYIFVNDPFGKNLVKNHCGQDKLKHWKILSSGGNRWTIENPPQGSDILPRTEEFGNLTSCFATSYHSCTKEQVIDLSTVGLNEKILDELQPHIEVSEWYAGRFDCGCIYELKVEILNSQKEEIQEFSCRRVVNQWFGREWYKESFVFKDYGPGARYVRFFHGGMDTQFWAGHYGSKMSGACVKLLIPPAPSVSPSCDVIVEDDDSESDEDGNET